MATNKETMIKIVAAIRDQECREQYGIDVFKALKKVIREKGFEGKPVSKRLATALQTELGESYTVCYSPCYGMFHIEVWGRGRKFDDRVSMLICHDSSATIRLGSSDAHGSGVEYFCNCYGDAAEKRQEKRRKALAEPGALRALAEAIDQLKEAKARIESFFEYGAVFNADQFSIQKATGIYERT